MHSRRTSRAPDSPPPVDHTTGCYSAGEANRRCQRKERQLETPADLKYSREHEWVRLEGDLATVGVTDFAQEQLGDIVYLDLPRVGIIVEQFGKVGEIESVKSVSELFTPIGGEVTEANNAAQDDPAVVNRSPYGEGWLYRLRVTEPEQMEKLMSAEKYIGQTGIDQG